MTQQRINSENGETPRGRVGELIPKLRDFRRTYIHLQQLKEQTQLREQTLHPERHATPPPNRWNATLLLGFAGQPGYSSKLSRDRFSSGPLQISQPRPCGRVQASTDVGLRRHKTLTNLAAAGFRDCLGRTFSQRQ